MKESRISYLTVIFIVIILGIFSRKIDCIPLFTGDLLYAVMIYFGVRLLFIDCSKIQSCIIALIVCYCIEFLQLYYAEWIIELRKTLFGRYVLGQGFLWSDIIAYTIGIIIAYYFEKIIMKRSSSRN